MQTDRITPATYADGFCPVCVEAAPGACDERCETRSSEQAFIVAAARKWLEAGVLPLPEGMTDAQALEIVENLYPGNLRAFASLQVPCRGAGCHAMPGERCLSRQSGAGWLHVVRERDARPLIHGAWQIMFRADGIAVESGWTLGA